MKSMTALLPRCVRRLMRILMLAVAPRDRVTLCLD